MTQLTTTPSEVQVLIGQLLKAAPDIENLVIAFSVKGKMMNVVVGTTGASPTMWVLGALDHVRWHVFNSLSLHKYVRDRERAEATVVSAQLKEEGGLN